MVSETLIRNKNIHYSERKVFEMNINIDKKKMQQVGKTALKVSRQIIIQGTVSVTAKGIANGLELGLNEGFNRVKTMSVDEFLGIDEEVKKTKTIEKVEVVEPAETQLENDSNDKED